MSPLPSSPGDRPNRSCFPSRESDGLVSAAAVFTTEPRLTGADHGSPPPEHVTPSWQKLALVLPEPADDLGIAAEGLTDAVESSELHYSLTTQTAFVDYEAPEAGVASLEARIRTGGVGLVVALGNGPDARALARVVQGMPETRFVFVDASLDELSLQGVPNAAAIRFSDEDAFYLGGYLTGLVPTMDGSTRGVDAVSVVAGAPTRDNARLIPGLRRGLRAARPGITLRVDYSRELEDVTACENLANRQIDDGSDVVVALSGRCSLGALAVARLRGVWGVGAAEDGIDLTDDVLMASEKEWTKATFLAIGRLMTGKPAMGRNTVLGFEDEYMVSMWWSNRAPEHAASAVIRQCSKMRATRHRDV
jgi:basic membrane lipoprotein Med (substrate-binding protein (PBP1-ABC) superfamily)